MSDNETARFVAIQGENVKRMKAFDMKLSPEGLIVVAGENGHGKTSFLDSFQYLIGGGRRIDAKPVRNGEKQSQIVGTIAVEGGLHDEQLTITRLIEANGKTTLEIKTADGYLAPEPQTLLDRFCKAIAFDPLAFTRMKPAEQVAQLQEVVGLDLSDLAEEHASLSAERTAVGREVKKLKGAAASRTFHDDAPDSEISITVLMSALKRMRTQNEENAAVRTKAKEAKTKYETAVRDTKEADKRLQDALARVKTLQEELDGAKSKESMAKTLADGAKAAADMRVDDDTQPLEEQIAESAALNDKFRENVAKETADAEAAAKQSEYDALTARLKAIGEEKQQRLSSVAWPVEGLNFTADGVTYQGIPLEQCATSEQLRVSVAIAAAAHPKLKTMFVRDGSLLGDDNIKLLHQIATENGFQILMEYALRDKNDKVPCSILIEDGFAYDTSAE